MRRLSFAPTLAVTLALAGCNANRPPPSLEAARPAIDATAAPSGTSTRVTPRAAADGGCEADIARYRAVQANDFVTGNVNKDVHTQIEAEITEAERACSAGDALRAAYLLRTSKQKHGYPAG